MINIKTKSDIIIPFSRIGDEGWLEKLEIIVSSLLRSWGTNINDVEFSQRTDEELDELEKRIEATLPHGLREYYKVFGIADVGDKLQEFDFVGRLAETWDLNAKPYCGPNFTEEELAIFPHLITFSDHRGNGNMFCFHDETKEIYYYDHATRPYISKMFSSIDDYIKACLISCQVDLFDLEIGQSKVDEWIKEIMVAHFGDEIYDKWEF